MRAICLALILITTGCGDDDYVPSGNQTDLSATVDAATAECNGACPAGCAADEVCFGDLDLGATPSRFPGTCMKLCVTTSDCPAGQVCATEASVYSEYRRLCMPADGPVRCPNSGYVGGCSAPEFCLDDILVTTFFPSGKTVCGQRFDRCANGCAGRRADDGGYADEDAGAAHCL